MAHLQMPFRSSPPMRVAGVILMALLIGLAVSSIALMGAVDMWTMESQRERERQLLFAGDQYRLAIQRYFYAAPTGTPKSLPLSFDVLLEDDRYPMPVRHLRRLYPDPVTGKPWGELRTPDGHLMGVYSVSDASPIKQAGFSHADSGFEDQPSYQNWIFAFRGAPRQAGNAEADPDNTRPAIPERPTFGITK